MASRRLLWLALCVALGGGACGGDDGGAGGAATTGTNGGAGGTAGQGGAAGQGGQGGLAAGGSGGAGGAGGGGASAGGGGEGGTGGGGGEPPCGGPSDPGVPLGGLGTIDGVCGVLDTELSSSGSCHFLNSLDFASLAYDYDALSAGGQKVYDDGNLGGSSIYSEIFAYEMLYRCELAQLLKTEAEIVYQDPGGKKTDLLVEIDGLTIGVSVTRAFKYPPSQPYTVADALALLEDKLADVLLSTANVDPADGWTKQILHVIAYADEHAASVAAAYDQVDPVIKADTLVIVTVTHGDDVYIY